MSDEYQQWLASQVIYTPADIQRISANLSAQIQSLPADEMQGFINDWLAKLKVLNGKNFQDAQQWLGTYLSVLTDGYRRQTLKQLGLTDVANMSAAQLDDAVTRIRAQQLATQQGQAAYQQSQQITARTIQQNNAAGQQADQQAGSPGAAQFGTNPSPGRAQNSIRRPLGNYQCMSTVTVASGSACRSRMQLFRGFSPTKDCAMKPVGASSTLKILFVAFAIFVAISAAPMQSVMVRMSEDDAKKIGVDAYIYAYPLVTMEMTRREMTNVEVPKDGHAPMGQFYNSRTYPDASFKDVTAPNADTLYSTAWLDLSKEPYILSLPDEGDRYFLIPMLSGWTDVFQVPGKRTTGDKAQKYAIVGPGWKGRLPDGVPAYNSPTNMVWILGRTYCTGTPDDYKAVHALQDKYSLVPASAYGKSYTPPKGKVDSKIDMKTPVREQVNAMEAGECFKLLAVLLKTNPPQKADGPMVERLAKIGLVPGKDFDISKLDPAVQKGLQAAIGPAQEKIAGHMKDAGKFVNGWVYPVPGGQYGVDYLQRATIAYFGLGCNRTKDAVYPTSETDADGQPYSGANQYVLHFASKYELPPVNAFWSLTMYNAAYFFVANPLNRYTLSLRDALKENSDGSIDFYIQNENPGGEKEANWLPAPKDKFVLMLRMYWPKEASPSILNGTWEPPPVKLVK